MRPWIANRTTLGKMEWESGIYWDFRIVSPTPPNPFNQWYPAVSFRLGLWILETESIEIGPTTIDIPSGTQQLTASLTFIDLEDYRLTKWLKNFVTTKVMNNLEGFSYLTESLINMQVAKTDRTGKSRIVYDIYALPKGSFDLEFDSEAGLRTKTVELSVMKMKES
jgi:hypothetical protein